MYKNIFKFLVILIFLLIFIIGNFIYFNKSTSITYAKKIKFFMDSQFDMKKIYNLYDILTIKYYHNKMTKCIENNINVQEEILDYKFFVAGHSYGIDRGLNKGLYPKFFDQLKLNHDYSFGILAGDIVHYAKNSYWDEVDTELNTLNYPIYFAPGNHDVGFGKNNDKRKIYTSRYGSTYSSFYFKNDLFIILDPNLDNWNIFEPQISFLKKTLDNSKTENKNVFIISHQLIWRWNTNLDFSRAAPNSLEGKTKRINFWTDIDPILKAHDKNYFLIAGDVGARNDGRELFCLKDNNFKYIATGMGGNNRDNYLVIESWNNNVKIKIIKF